jgi:hypothetical protein
VAGAVAPGEITMAWSIPSSPETSFGARIGQMVTGARDWATQQAEICRRLGQTLVSPGPNTTTGVSHNIIGGQYAKDQTYPLTGLRHRVDGDTTGWYIWAGEMSSASDFYVPVHTSHLETYCPEAMPFLGLPPGWWFLIAPEQADTWYDASLLST